MSRDGRGPRRGRLLGALAALVLLATLTMDSPARGDAALVTADLLRFLRAGISEGTILTELKARGFGEPMEADQETALRAAGATETLIVAVRRAAPVDRPVVVSPPSTPVGAPVPSAALPAVVLPGGSHGPTFSAAARTVRVPVSVLDKDGEPVMGLRFEDFHILDDGRKQDVTLFSGERRALRIALALDVSGSTHDKIRQVEAALRHFIDLLEPADEIMVITFNDHVSVVQDFTSDRALLGRVLDMLEPEGATALFDAAHEAIQRVARGPAESKAVVLVTDGVDTESATSFNTLRDSRAALGGARLLDRTGRRQPAAGLLPPAHHSSSGRRRRRARLAGRTRRLAGAGRTRWLSGRWRRGRRGMAGGGAGGTRGVRTAPAGFDARALLDLAEETGGRAEIVKGFEHYTPGAASPGGDRLKTAVESIAMTLRHRYLLGYEPPEGRAGWRAIKVEVDRPSTSAHARKGYYSTGS